MSKRNYLATLALAAGVAVASSAIAQTPTSPTPTMSNNPGASATTDPSMATDPGMSPATAHGNDVMATPASPDSSMSKGTTGRKHMKKHKPDTMSPSATSDVTSNGMSNTTAPR